MYLPRTVSPLMVVRSSKGLNMTSLDFQAPSTYQENAPAVSVL